MKRLFGMQYRVIPEPTVDFWVKDEEGNEEIHSVQVGKSEEVNDFARKLVFEIGKAVGPRYVSPDFYSSHLQEMEKLTEKLAELEHEQWAHWTRHMLDHLNAENIQRWRKQCATPYDQLTEKEKESDRFWARKVIQIIEGE